MCCITPLLIGAALLFLGAGSIGGGSSLITHYVNFFLGLFGGTTA